MDARTSVSAVLAALEGTHTLDRLHCPVDSVVLETLSQSDCRLQPFDWIKHILCQLHLPHLQFVPASAQAIYITIYSLRHACSQDETFPPRLRCMYGMTLT